MKVCVRGWGGGLVWVHEARTEDRFGKQRRTCIGTQPPRDNRNGVVKIERGLGIGQER